MDGLRPIWKMKTRLEEGPAGPLRSCREYSGLICDIPHLRNEALNDTPDVCGHEDGPNLSYYC